MGFHVYVTADHGNVEAVGQGRPKQGLAAEMRGERVRTYRSETLVVESAVSNPVSFRLDVAGLPANFLPLFCRRKNRFHARRRAGGCARWNCCRGADRSVYQSRQRALIDMAPVTPKIGFDRFIDLRWIAAAMNVRTGDCSIEDLIALLDAAGLSVAAKKKVRTILNRLWLEPLA